MIILVPSNKVVTFWSGVILRNLMEGGLKKLVEYKLFYNNKNQIYRQKLRN